MKRKVWVVLAVLVPIVAYAAGEVFRGGIQTDAITEYRTGAGVTISKTKEIGWLNPLTTSTLTPARITTATISPVRQTTWTFSSALIPVTYASPAGYSASKLGSFPEGRILILGCTAKLAWNVAGQGNMTQTGSGDWSFGTTATDDTTLDSTEVDLVPKIAMTDPFVAGVGAATGGALASSAHFDGTSTAKSVFLNTAWDSGDVAGSFTAKATGNLTCSWVPLGDY